MPHADVADTIIVRDGERVLRRAGRRRRRSSRPARSTPRARSSPSASTARRRGDHGDRDGRAWHAIAVMAAAESVGVAARVTAMTVEYAKERKQFGRPIGSYQAVSHACAQMFLETEGARNVAYWAAWALDHDPEAAFMAANCAKAYASDAAVNVCRSVAPGPRRHRLHVGARPAPVPQARRGQRPRLRRRGLAPRTGGRGAFVTVRLRIWLRQARRTTNERSRWRAGGVRYNSVAMRSSCPAPPSIRAAGQSTPISDPGGHRRVQAVLTFLRG